MELKYISDHLFKRIDGWHSPTLGMHMPIAVYGDRGHPLLVFPTAAADFLETERFFLIKAIEPHIFAGRIQVFSIDSINTYAWMAGRRLPVAEKARRQALYSRYVEDEVVGYIRGVSGNPHARIATTGSSFGAFHAANVFLRRPDLFDGLIAMSGFYDLGPDYLEGYGDDNVYFNNPTSYLPGLDGPLLSILQTACKIQVMTGQGPWEHPDASRGLSRLLSE